LSVGYEQSKYWELRKEISEVMKALKIKDAIISRIDCMPELCSEPDNYAEKTPYIRLCCSNGEETEKIIQGMIKAGIEEDVEILKLDGFISKDNFKKGKGLEVFEKTVVGRLLSMKREDEK